MITPPILAASVWPGGANVDTADVRSWAGWVETKVFSGKVTAKSVGFTVLEADRTDIFRCTAGLTVALTSAATLGNGFAFGVIADGGDVVIDPAASETVNGATTLTISDGNACAVYSDGTNWQAIVTTAPVASLDQSVWLTGTGTSEASITPAKLRGATEIQRGTSQVTTSGTAFDFTGIPAGVNRVIITFDGVSLTGADNPLIQLGDATSVEATGYVAVCGSGSSFFNSTAAFPVFLQASSLSSSGSLTLTRMTGNKWIAQGVFTRGTECGFAAGSKTLAGELTRVRVTRTGSSTFDAGAVNVLWGY